MFKFIYYKVEKLTYQYVTISYKGIKSKIAMTKIYFIDIMLSIIGVFIYFFGLKKLLFNQLKTF